MRELRCHGSRSLMTMLLILGTAANAADLKRGESLFVACLACHNSKAEAVGPSLAGILDRKAASVRGFRYSSALRGSNITWSDANLRLFVGNPQALIPGNRMAFDGMSNGVDLADLIAYVETL